MESGHDLAENIRDTNAWSVRPILRAPSVRLGGNGTYAPDPFRLWLLELLDDLIFATSGCENAGREGSNSVEGAGIDQPILPCPRRVRR